MSILIIAPTRDMTIWQKGIQKILPAVKVEQWPDVENDDAVECVVAWNHPSGSLNRFKNLGLVCSMGAGVDHIVSDTSINENIRITKVVDEKLAFSMSNYIVMATMMHHRRLQKFMNDQEAHRWDQQVPPEIDVHIGIMGFGQLGQDAGQKLVALGFDVHGLSKTRVSHPSISTYGEEEQDQFFQNINVLVCLLPYTSATHAILDYKLFAQLQKGTYLINVARGKHQVEEDIIKAIDEGLLSGAFLDVFQQEPLPKDSPLWDHPKVTLTPHNASLTNPDAAIPQIAENFTRMQSGKELLFEIDRSKGY